MTPSRLVILPAFAAITVLALTGCSGSSGSSPASSSSASASTSTSSSTSSRGTLSTTCLTAAVISTDVGSPYPEPKRNAGGGLVQCVYADDSTEANLNYAIGPSGGLSASAVKAAFQSEAQAVGVSTVTDVSGLGDAAFQFVEDDASTNADHVATTTVEVLVGSQVVTIDGTVAPAGVVAVAHSVVG